MPDNIINTVFPVRQGFDSVPTEVRAPAFPGTGGVNDQNSDLVKGNEFAPGLGVPAEPFGSTPASVADPNSTPGGLRAPGQGAPDDSPTDDSNSFSADGPVTVQAVGTALGRVDGGLLQPGGAPVNVTQNNVASQVFGQGAVQNVNGGSH